MGKAGLQESLAPPWNNPSLYQLFIISLARKGYEIISHISVVTKSAYCVLILEYYIVSINIRLSTYQLIF